MQKIVTILVIIAFLCGPSVFAKPKAAQANPTATPHPKMWLMGFTFTMTDVARNRLAYPDGSACGITQPKCGCVSGLLALGDHGTYIWTRKGEFNNPSEPSEYSVIFKAGRYDSTLADVTADDVRDIFGADAISNVREIPYEQFQHQQQTQERVAIINALKLSAGSTAQAAVRLNMKEADLQKKIVEYGIPNVKR